MVRTVRKVPDEWETCDAVGQLIGNTRLFAFKTPLKRDLYNRVKKGAMFTTQDLFRSIAESGRTLGLVINCCFTERYYDRADIEGMMIGYKWIPCPSRNFVNRTELVKFFCKTVDEFLAENQNNNLLIGVHCSNGVNRSGYLICRYLIDRLGWSSHDALNAFEVARGHPIERSAFIQALHKADRERRLGRSELTQDDEALKADRKKRKRKCDVDIPGLDPALTAQMMQQFYQMEQRMKEAAENAILGGGNLSASHSPVGSGGANGGPPAPHYHYQQQQLLNMSQTTTTTDSTLNFSQQLYETTTTTLNEEDYDESPGDNNFKDRIVDFDSMGKIDVRETSASESRRNRRKRLDKQFQVMKRGKFWEINEMRKDLGI